MPNLYSPSTMAGMAISALTMNSPLYEGPIASALGGADLSWILGLPVAALVYAALVPHAPLRSHHA